MNMKILSNLLPQAIRHEENRTKEHLPVSYFPIFGKLSFKIRSQIYIASFVEQFSLLHITYDTINRTREDHRAGVKRNF